MLTALGRLAKWRWSEPLGVGVVLAMVIVGSVAEAYPSHRYAGLDLRSHPSVWAFAVLAVPAVSLRWRLSYPLGVYVATVAGVVAWALLGQVYGAALVMVLVAMYTLSAARLGRAGLIAVGAAGAISIWIAGGLVGPWGWWGGPQLDMWAEMAAAGAAGAFVSARRHWKASEILRAEQVEASRLQETRRLVTSERLRIARELHDVVAHSMAMINVQASAAVTLVNADPLSVTESLQAIRRASKDGLRELRSILEVLRQVDEEQPAVALPDVQAFKALVDAGKSAGMRCTLTWDAELTGVAAGSVLATYRIVQESLTNIIRHAAGSVASVSVVRCDELIVVDVVNDGRATAEPFVDGAASGLNGMRERARAIGGTVTAGPIQGGGFRVHAELPVSSTTATEEAMPDASPDLVVNNAGIDSYEERFGS